MAARRLFLAISLPARLKEDIAEAVPILERYTSGSARFVAKENLHITLVFLGARQREEVGRVAELTREAARVAPIELTTTVFGCFPGPGRARVLWLGATSAPELRCLHENLVSALTAAALLSPATRPPTTATPVSVSVTLFKPHITVARYKRPGSVDIGGLNERVRIVRSIPVEKITLFESELRREGVRHTVVEEFYLSV